MLDMTMNALSADSQAMALRIAQLEARIQTLEANPAQLRGLDKTAMLTTAIANALGPAIASIGTTVARALSGMTALVQGPARSTLMAHSRTCEP